MELIDLPTTVRLQMMKMIDDNWRGQLANHGDAPLIKLTVPSDSIILAAAGGYPVAFGSTTDRAREGRYFSRKEQASVLRLANPDWRGRFDGEEGEGFGE